MSSLDDEAAAPSTSVGISAMSRPKMKINVISRSKLDYVRQSTKDMHKVQRNVDPALHPFEKAREYTRALNAVKLDKMFAKPFVFALNEHKDSVYCMGARSGSLVHLLSGACDGGACDCCRATTASLTGSNACLIITNPLFLRSLFMMFPCQN